MMKWLCFLLLLPVALPAQVNWKSISPQTDASFRGLAVVDDRVAWVSGSKGWVGRSTDGGEHWTFAQVKGYEQCDFRSLHAFDAKRAVIANAGSPAYILLTNDSGASWQKVYENADSLAFFDGIDFWNKKKGIIYGDPRDGHLDILRTDDGGGTWSALPIASRPEMQPGEASFAASGTTIRCMKRGKVMIATGGKVSRLLISGNYGEKWRSRKTPIIQGKASTGVFSFTAIGRGDLVIVGGDYLQDTLRQDHVFYSDDAGATWCVPKKPTCGYRECVLVVNSTTLLATGPLGTDISRDAGKTWEPASDERQYHVIRKSCKGNLIIAAGGGGRIAIINCQL